GRAASCRPPRGARGRRSTPAAGRSPFGAVAPACPFQSPARRASRSSWFLFSEQLREGRYASVAARSASNALEPRTHDREDLAEGATAARSFARASLARVLAGLADQRAQPLRIGVSILREPSLEGLVAVEQRIAFALRAMQQRRLARRRCLR